MIKPGAEREFVVHLNRRSVDRQYAIVIAVWAGLALIGLIGFVSLSVFSPSAGPAVAGPLVFTVVCLPNLVVYIWIWRRTRKLDPVLVISGWGLSAKTPRGALSLPWTSIASVEQVKRIGTRQLVVRLDPSVGPDSEAIETTLSVGGWRFVRRQGLWFSFKTTKEPAAAVIKAVTDLSAGRFRPKLSV